MVVSRRDRTAPLVLALAVGLVCAGSKEGRVDNMVFAERASSQVLDAYLDADEKYHVAPLPVHLERALVGKRAAAELAVVPRLPRLRRLSRLAIFYDLSESAETFLGLATPTAGIPPELEIGALAVQTLGWIGSPGQKVRAGEALDTLMASAAPERPARRALLAVFRAWGPELDPARLERWLAEGRRALTSSMEQARNGGATARAESLEDDIDELDAFQRGVLADTLQENELRKELGMQPPNARVPRLVRLYLEDSPGSSPEMSYWAAITLVRLSRQTPAVSEDIARAFVELAAELHEARPTPPDDEPEKAEETGAFEDPEQPLETDPDDALDADERAEEEDEARRAADDRYGEDDPQLEADLARASCLRAALFFDGELADEDSAWLAEQDDAGTDLLASRPDWDYARR